MYEMFILSLGARSVLNVIFTCECKLFDIFNLVNTGR